MASKITQSARRNVGVFGTHRGRMARNLLLAVGALGFSLTFVNGMVNSTSADPASAAASEMTVEEEEAAALMAAQKPEVKATVYDPFTVEDGAGKDAISVRGTKVDPETGLTVEGAAEAEDDPLYSYVVPIAGDFARQYATYSFEQTPKQYGESLGAMRPEMRDALGEATERSWPGIVRDRVVAVGMPSGSQPLVTRFDGAAGTATVSVVIRQEVSGAKGEHVFMRSYLVDLMKTANGDGWEVSAVQG